ncbi:MAG: hypothetical protein IKD34_06245 [Oscillospiraceae bacterium]|nr:hypothetical protein [Oscillospiraceae bacterium]
MKNLKKEAVFTALLTTVCSVVPAYAGDNSIVGPVLWVAGGSGLLIAAYVVLIVLGKKKK